MQLLYARISRRLFAGLALTIFVFGLDPAALAAPQHPYPEGRLWRLERPGLVPSYLFGTMHSTDPKVVALPEPVAAALNAADSVTLELVLPTGSTVQVVAASDNGSRPTEEVLAPEQLNLAIKAAARYGLSTADVLGMSPGALSMLFSVPPSEMKRRQAGRSFLDLSLQIKAEERGIPVYGLETLEEQLAALNGLQDSDQRTLFDAVLAYNRDIEARFNELRDIYLAGDLAGLHTLSNRDTHGNRRLRLIYMDKLIDARNEVMARRMIERLFEGNAFVAVGALHLSGERGILALLARSGFQISRAY